MKIKKKETDLLGVLLGLEVKFNYFIGHSHVVPSGARIDLEACLALSRAECWRLFGIAASPVILMFTFLYGAELMDVVLPWQVPALLSAAVGLLTAFLFLRAKEMFIPRSDIVKSSNNNYTEIIRRWIDDFPSIREFVRENKLLESCSPFEGELVRAYVWLQKQNG